MLFNKIRNNLVKHYINHVVISASLSRCFFFFLCMFLCMAHWMNNHQTKQRFNIVWTLSIRQRLRRTNAISSWVCPNSLADAISEGKQKTCHHLLKRWKQRLRDGGGVTRGEDSWRERINCKQYIGLLTGKKKGFIYYTPQSVPRPPPLLFLITTDGIEVAVGAYFIGRE